MTMPKIERDTITNLVLNKCITNDNNLIANFLSIFQHLYQYEIFKNILDIVVTKCATNQLHFKLQDSRFFDLDAGNCLTMVEDEGYVSLPSQHTYVSGNSTQLRIRKKKYIITIKKMSCDVIIHEIGHMIEQELSSVLNLKQFSDVIMYEIYTPNTTSMHLHDLLNSVFVGQLKGYPQSQHTSELFARFFQVFAGANEVAFQSSLGSRYRLCDVIAVFPKTIALLEEQLAGNWNELVDQTISMESKKYLRNISDMKEQWTDRRITATHQQSDVKSKWSKNIKSIKSDPFK